MQPRVHTGHIDAWDWVRVCVWVVEQWRRKEIESGGPPVAYLESAKGGGRESGGRKSPRSWSFVVNEWL